MTHKIRLGLVGLRFGLWASRRIIAHPELPVRLERICDLDLAHAETCSKELGVAVAPNLQAMLDDDQIDAICLFTEPTGRANLIRKVIRAGKDVMTTKPFETDPQAAWDILQEARSLGRIVHLNSPNARPFGEMAVIRDWVDSGSIGTPVVAQANAWANYGATKPDGTWYDDPRRCPAAPVFRIGIYMLNNLLQVFGEPVEVQVTTQRFQTKRPTPDNASLTISFADGGIVNIVASFAVGGPDNYKNSMTIGGTKGVIYFATGPKARDGGVTEILLSTDDRLERRELTGVSGEYDWDFFAQRVRGEIKQDVTTPLDIVRAIHVVRAMSAAELSGESVRVEKFQPAVQPHASV